MKALTLWRPWPWAIFHAPHNPKRIENRGWKPPRSIEGQRIALHAGKTFDSEAADHLCALYGLHPDGDVPSGWADEGLIGVATIQGFRGSQAEAERFLPGQSSWWSGPYAWLLKDVVTFAEPIPAKGKQGLWALTPTQELAVNAFMRAA